jgi:hypothetical protein
LTGETGVQQKFSSENVVLTLSGGGRIEAAKPVSKGCANPSHRWQQDTGEDTGSDLVRAPAVEMKNSKSRTRNEATKIKRHSAHGSDALLTNMRSY